MIDVHFVADLIAELHLDEEVGRVEAAEDVTRQLSTVARVQEDQRARLRQPRPHYRERIFTERRRRSSASPKVPNTSARSEECWGPP